MSDPDTGVPTGVGSVLSDRGFWTIFAAAWLAYFGLFVSFGATVEGGGLGWAFRMGLVNAGPPALLAVLVALRREDLLRPERTLLRTILLHAAIGLVFALLTAAIGTTLSGKWGMESPELRQAGPGAAFLYRTVSGAFLYAVLAGFLMWAESLRRVHESRSLVAREGMLRAQAEAKALRAQFNPHFVFNTLHSLMLLVRADPAAAERAIEDVATLIRYASILQRRDLDTVPLGKELEVARRYAGLEKLRLEDRLEVIFDVRVDPDVVAIPAFALQTLLENAVKHGVEPAPRGGTVRVGVVQERDRLRVTVGDDGVGADPAVVAAAVGHGLSLLERRLATLYGTEAALSWRTVPGGGFVASVELPVTRPAIARELDVIPMGAEA